MKPIVRTLAICALMICASGFANVMRPTQKIADLQEKWQLETVIPKAFGDWKIDPAAMSQVVTPSGQTLSAQLYAQTLNRSYINAQGERIMLSIAYGTDQRESLQVHKPEFCYVAQGFEILASSSANLATPYGNLPVQRLETRQLQRYEPLTYWTTIGSNVIHSPWQKRWIELDYGLRRQIPDGLIFRVSSIDHDTVHAYAIQNDFIGQLLKAFDTTDRKRIAGIFHSV